MSPRPVRPSRLGGRPGPSVLAAVFARWEDLVGADIAAHARPRSLRDGVLVWSWTSRPGPTQLRFMAADILSDRPP